ncbi:hypothetical protein BT67DRAFT_486121 [Trichocladium antarcticum]|uniref:Uncharacterized protein n=1 Tax=Trichocladium antarcticum TaxID=1450529 RepID=A0AAN6UGY7_9PEZI|nr:hypothetical protein BT67DRAFT_486121 [Trichocladium antarcticum]
MNCGSADPPRPASRSCLRPPPGFEDLIPTQGTEACETPAVSSLDGATHGIFPFPPASPSESSSDSICSTSAKASSEYSTRDVMERTNAFFTGHHHKAMVALLEKKFQDILDYDKTKNRGILHLDWVAANPRDPANTDGSDSATGGIGFTHGVLRWEPDEAVSWNKSLFYGDWLYDPKGLRQFYVEIQVKRISGADDVLLEQCGISSRQVWLSLHDHQAPAIEPAPLPPGVAKSAVPAMLAARGLSFAEIQEARLVSLMPAPSLLVPKSSADKGNGNGKGKGKATTPAPEEAPAIVFGSASQPATQQQRPLPSIDSVALAHATPGAAEAVPPRTGIPRSTYQHLPIAADFDPPSSPACIPEEKEEEEQENDDDDDTDSGLSTDESLDDDDDDDDDGDADTPSARDTPILSAAEFHARRAAFDLAIQHTIGGIRKMYNAFENEPGFLRRKEQSFVYAVRVLAIPDRGNVVSDFAGPRSVDRYGTLLAQGGWVVPPRAERIARAASLYRGRAAPVGRYEGAPRPMADLAVPCRFDWSNELPPRYFGQPPPLWAEVSEPCLEDVYWMVWQLVAGRQFVGFQPGTGFGVGRPNTAGEAALLDNCPFKSPSAEAMYHAASYPRGDESKQ